MASNLKSAKHVIAEELNQAKEGVAYYQNRVEQLEQLLEQITNIEAGRQASHQQEAVPAKRTVARRGRKPRASTNRAAGLPVTGGEFWLNLVTHKQQSAVEIASAAIAQLGLTGRNKAQIQKLKQRVVPGLNGLLSADKIKDSGKGRDRRFFRD